MKALKAPCWWLFFFHREGAYVAEIGVLSVVAVAG